MTVAYRIINENALEVIIFQKTHSYLWTLVTALGTYETDNGASYATQLIGMGK